MAPLDYVSAGDAMQQWYKIKDYMPVKKIVEPT